MSHVISTGELRTTPCGAPGFPQGDHLRHSDAALARRLPGLANYLAASFPALRRLDIVIARDRHRRLLEVRFAFQGSNVERLFRNEIQPPCAAHDMLTAFAVLEAALRQAMPTDCPDWLEIDLTVRLDRQRRNLQALLGRCKARLPPDVAAAYALLSTSLDDLAQLLAGGSPSVPPATADLLRTAEALVRSLSELVDGSGHRPA